MVARPDKLANRTRFHFLYGLPFTSANVAPRRGYG
jgi:hypothetical protein